MGLLDWFRTLRRGTPAKPGGTDGVASFGGHLISMEKRQELRGRNLYTTYAEMLSETVIVAAAVRYFQNLIGGTTPTITANEESPDGERAAEIVRKGLVEAQLETMPFPLVVRKAALYRFYGFSAHEWSIRRNAKTGMIVYKDIQHRPQYSVDLWDIPEEGGRMNGLIQRVYGRANLYYVDREQMFYCVDNTLNDNPDGVGVLRHVVEHARRLQTYEKYEGYGYQRDLRGVPLAKVPGSQLQRQSKSENKPSGWVSEQLSGITQIVQAHGKTPFQGIVVDSEVYRDNEGNPSAVPQWAFELIQGDGQGLTEIAQVIERLNREISRVLGMEFLMLGGDGKGSLALSRDKTSMFASVLEATTTEMAYFATHDLVYPLLRMNGLDPEECAPKFGFDAIATERVEAAVAALVGLAQAGATLSPDDPAINQIRARLHLAEAVVVNTPTDPGMELPRVDPDDESVDVDMDDDETDPDDPNDRQVDEDDADDEDAPGKEEQDEEADEDEKPKGKSKALKRKRSRRARR